MREYKFRGKILYNGNHFLAGGWIEGSYVKKSDNTSWIYYIEEDKYGNIIREELVQVDPKTVGQYTGKTDLKGKYIYEKDIVRVLKDHTNCTFCNDFEEEGIHEVVFNSSMYGLVPYPRLVQFRNLIFAENESIEIIGNTIDNKEL